MSDIRANPNGWWSEYKFRYNQDTKDIYFRQSHSFEYDGSEDQKTGTIIRWYRATVRNDNSIVSIYHATATAIPTGWVRVYTWNTYQIMRNTDDIRIDQQAYDSFLNWLSRNGYKV